MNFVARIALLSAVTLTTVPNLAHADIVTALSSVPSAISGGYAYTYNVQLTGGQLDAVTNGLPVQFGTVYDFGPTFGTITTTGLLNQFTWSLTNISTPTADLTTPIDDPAIQNIRFTYVGTQDIVVDGQTTTKPNPLVIDSTANNLGTFTVNSVYGPALFTTRVYDGQSYKGSNDTIQGNVGRLSAPLLPTDVPEPASLALLGSAVLGLGMIRRRA